MSEGVDLRIPLRMIMGFSVKGVSVLTSLDKAEVSRVVISLCSELSNSMIILLFEMYLSPSGCKSLSLKERLLCRACIVS